MAEVEMLAFAIHRFRADPGGWAAHLDVRDAIAHRDGAQAHALVEAHLRDVHTALHPDNLDPAVIKASPRRRRSRPS